MRAWTKVTTHHSQTHAVAYEHAASYRVEAQGVGKQALLLGLTVGQHEAVGQWVEAHGVVQLPVQGLLVHWQRTEV